MHLPHSSFWTKPCVTLVRDFLRLLSAHLPSPHTKSLCWALNPFHIIHINQFNNSFLSQKLYPVTLAGTICQYQPSTWINTKAERIMVLMLQNGNTLIDHGTIIHAFSIWIAKIKHGFKVYFINHTHNHWKNYETSTSHKCKWEHCISKHIFENIASNSNQIQISLLLYISINTTEYKCRLFEVHHYVNP